ncbi:hypothetical protein SADUNF_Sadunf16G0176400 [Salix dunnii]|uniref:Uncharacterized protein n=1 Tax=Salix dunnii TaxID=1413687 RepID=A0A835MH95_9ROSI|nr:hypothetical protein SADUNF_Sadunf16G0176400 [Salix dunnii]
MNDEHFLAQLRPFIFDMETLSMVQQVTSRDNNPRCSYLLRNQHEITRKHPRSSGHSHEATKIQPRKTSPNSTITSLSINEAAYLCALNLLLHRALYASAMAILLDVFEGVCLCVSTLWDLQEMRFANVFDGAGHGLSCFTFDRYLRPTLLKSYISKRFAISRCKSLKPQFGCKLKRIFSSPKVALTLKAPPSCKAWLLLIGSASTGSSTADACPVLEPLMVLAKAKQNGLGLVGLLGYSAFLRN